jgi:hypothetical protein
LPIRQLRKPPLPFHRAGEKAENETPMPPDLSQVVAVWPHLPEAVKAGIVAMVSTASLR